MHLRCSTCLRACLHTPSQWISTSVCQLPAPLLQCSACLAHRRYSHPIPPPPTHPYTLLPAGDRGSQAHASASRRDWLAEQRQIQRFGGPGESWCRVSHGGGTAAAIAAKANKRQQHAGLRRMVRRPHGHPVGHTRYSHRRGSGKPPNLLILNSCTKSVVQNSSTTHDVHHPPWSVIRTACATVFCLNAGVMPRSHVSSAGIA